MLLPLGPQARLMRNKKRIKTGKATKFPKQIEATYAASLVGYNEAMQKAFMDELARVLRKTEVEYVQDSFIDEIAAAYEQLKNQWEIAASTAMVIANRFTQAVNQDNKSKVHKQLTEAMGIDILGMVRTENLEGQLKGAVKRNISLIRSIPEQNLYKIEQIIYQETVVGQTADSIIDQINEVFDVGERRARMIARDQTAKLNSALTKARHQAMGIRAYTWRTVTDERVRSSHDNRNGRVYAYEEEDVGKTLSDGRVLLDPKKDNIGNPGEDFNCRCIAEPILELDRMGLAA